MSQLISVHQSSSCSVYSQLERVRRSARISARSAVTPLRYENLVLIIMDLSAIGTLCTATNESRRNRVIVNRVLEFSMYVFRVVQIVTDLKCRRSSAVCMKTCTQLHVSKRKVACLVIGLSCTRCLELFSASAGRPLLAIFDPGRQTNMYPCHLVVSPVQCLLSHVVGLYIL